MRWRMRLPAAFSARASTSSLSEVLGVVVVVADVEAGARLRRDHVPGLVADVDRNEFEVRRLKVRVAVVERLGVDGADQRGDVGQRIGRAIGIGNMALLAVDDQRAGERTPAADLDAVAELGHVARLAQHAMIEFFAALGRPLQKFDGAVDGDVLLIARDQERDRALRLAAVGRQMFQHGGDRAGDAALHVDGAAAVQHAVLHLARERRQRPCRLVAGRHHVGVAREHKVRSLRADPRKKVVDVGGARLGEGDAMHVKARVAEQPLQHAERAGVGGRDGGAADQVADDGDGVSHGVRLTCGERAPAPRRAADRRAEGRADGHCSAALPPGPRHAHSPRPCRASTRAR